MFEWIIKISIASVLFTLASFILPKGNIQKASLTALSFLFLAIIIVPLKNITSELINKKLTLEYEKNQLISQIETNSAETEVIKYYVNRISVEVKESLENKKYKCDNIAITVNEDTSSKDFGKVLNVICDLKVNHEDEKNTIDKIKVPDIVIDKNGIKFENNDTQKPDMSPHEKEVKEIIRELTGVDINRITIRWE